MNTTITQAQKAQVKTWLSRAYKLELEVVELERARTRTYDRLTSITQGYDDSGGSNPSPDPHKLDAVGDVAKKLDARIEELSKIQLEIFRAIDTINAPDVRAVLLARYINGMRWEEISVEMHCTERMVYFLHNDGLAALASVLNI